MKADAARYAQLVAGYVRADSEAALTEIAELGRAMVRSGTPPEEIATLHAAAVDAVGPNNAQARACEPLAELLMAYGLEFRHRSALQSQLEFLQAALDALSAYIAILDEDGRILAVNEAWRRFDQHNALIIANARSGTDYLAHCDSAGDRPHAQRVVSGIQEVTGGSATQFQLEYEEGGAWFRVSVVRYAGEGPPRLVVAHDDITLQKAAEQRMRALNAELERAVDERTRDLRAANDELEAFSHALAHDLRTPLRSISGFAEILAEDIGAELGEEPLGYLDRITSNIERMAARIDAFMEFSHVSKAPSATERVDLSALAHATADALRTGQPDRDVEFHIEPDAVVLGDERLLSAVVENLLENAWKYSGREPRARIEFRHTLTDGERLCSVRDNGAGYDPRYGEKLFFPFRRLHHPHEYAGVGLGLATVRRIVERHGGEVGSEGEPGVGARFWFTLPAPRPDR